MTISFDDARSIAAAAPEILEFYGAGLTVADFGWENDELFVVAPFPADGLAAFDAPDVLVDKGTGELTTIFGLLGRSPAEGLVPIGDVPE